MSGRAPTDVTDDAQYLYERNKARITEVSEKLVGFSAATTERLATVQRDVADLKLAMVEAGKDRSQVKQIVIGMQASIGQLVTAGDRAASHKHDWLKTFAAAVLAFGAAIAMRGIKC